MKFSKLLIVIACAMLATVVGMFAVLCFTFTAEAQTSSCPTCDMDGIGSVVLEADVPLVTILDATEETTLDGVPYCLVKVLVPEAINIWVGLPMDGEWNGRLQSEGGGVYCGFVDHPQSVSQGYVGVTTDTGHKGFVPPGAPPFFAMLDGSFGMLEPGVPNIPLQIDFSYRSLHLMAVIGKQLTEHFYGEQPVYSYWTGCSTGGRQGLAMAQRYPEDYDGILAGAPAIHFDRFQAAMIWPQIVSYLENGGPVPLDKLALATEAAVAACDGLDGIVDGILRDPRQCCYDARELICEEGQDPDTCLTETEAAAINKIWYGPTNEKGNKRLWYGEVHGTDLSALAGPEPFSPAIQQPMYWVYFDPTWDWHVLNYSNYESFFNDTIDQMAASEIATDNPNLAPFRNSGGKIILWHGFSDQLIMPEGTINYYNRVVKALGGGYRHTKEFARLFMAPGVAHCGMGGTGLIPQNLFDYLVDWVENGVAPDTILASQLLPDGSERTRPLCPYPYVAKWNGSGSTDDWENFECKRGRGNYPHWRHHKWGHYKWGHYNKWGHYKKWW